MDKQQLMIQNSLVLANVFEVVKNTMGKIGLEYLAPIEDAAQNEQISKSLTKHWGMNNDH